MSCLCSFTLLPYDNSKSSFTFPPVSRCRARIGLASILLLFAGFLLAGRAAAQRIPDVPPPTCVDVPGIPCGRSGSSDDSGERSDPFGAWKARWEAGAAARKQHKAERDARKARQDIQKLARQRAKEDAARQAEYDRLQRIKDQQQREKDAERQRMLAIEAQRLQDAFNAVKPGVVSGLKGVNGAPAGANGLGLKGADDASPSWTATITDPQAAKYARHLASIVPPMPMPEKEVAVTWKQIYLNNDRLMNTTDLVVTAWKMTGVLGKEMAGPAEWIIIGGKTFIAGEDGAYLHLVNQEKDYDAALAYLKNPAQAQKFAHLVQDVRENRALPASADPAMVKAARAITDPKLGNSGVAIAIDSMTSKEALSAMFRKAAIEVGSKKLGDKAEELIKDMSARKALYDSVRVDREAARHMLAQESITQEQRAQYKTIVDHANRTTANIYRVEKVVNVAVGEGINEATGKIAETLLGPEAKGRQY
jgi:hypothetical protein